LRLDLLRSLKEEFPDLSKTLERVGYIEGDAEGSCETSVGFVSRRYEQTTMLLHGDPTIRLLSAPLTERGRTYRTILVHKSAYATAMLAGLNYLKLEGCSESVDEIEKKLGARLQDLSESISLAYRLAPLLSHRWELAAGYQKAVLTAAEKDVRWIDWPGRTPRRKILIMSAFLPHMREALSRQAFETASDLCVNDLEI